MVSIGQEFSINQLQNRALVIVGSHVECFLLNSEKNRTVEDDPSAFDVSTVGTIAFYLALVHGTPLTGNQHSRRKV